MLLKVVLKIKMILIHKQLKSKPINKETKMQVASNKKKIGEIEKCPCGSEKSIKIVGFSID